MGLWVIALYAVYAVLGVLLRLWIQRRRTGSTGFKILRAKRFSIGWIAVTILAIAAFGGIAGAILDLARIIRPLAALDSRPGHTVGILVFLSALAVQFYSQTAMGDSWRIGVDQSESPALVTGGPFALVRNPIYSAAAVMSIALFLVLPNVLMIGSLVAQTVGVELQVRGVEEPYLLNNHHQQYRDYASRVGRFVPFVGRLR
jgi:protein-S-isoprenylcysteine O-methyltransferase Ste14